MRIRPRHFLVVSVLLSACGRSADARSDAFALSDSAGVQIAESSGPAWEAGEEWTIGAQPTLQIGEAEGAPQYMLNQVRSVVRLGSGAIAAATGMTEFRIFDASGRHLRTVGRRGGGPGEFQMLSALYLLPGDSIVAYDLQARRLSFHDAEGAFVRSVTLASTTEGGLPQIVAVLPDHSLVARTTNLGEGMPDEGLQRPPELFLHLDSLGAPLDSITVQPGSERFLRIEQSNGQMMSMSMTSPIFGRSQLAAVGGDRLFVGGNDSWAIEEFALDGTLRRVIRRIVDPRPVTQELADSATAERLAGISSETARLNVERDMKAIPLPETMPFYLSAKSDAAGNLWVQEFASSRDAAVHWSVFDPEGRYLGTVTLPVRFRLDHIGNDFVLGVGRDEMDVERIQMYALEKP